MSHAASQAAPAIADWFGGASVISAISASALWVSAIVDDWPRMTATGSLCGEANGLLGHCAACAPAAALTLLAVGLAFASWNRTSRA